MTNWRRRDRATVDGAEKRSVAPGVFRRCEGCGVTLLEDELALAWEVCPRCGFHHRLAPARWVAMLTDPGSFAPIGASLRPNDPLGFSDGQTYPDRIARSRRQSGESEAVLVGDAAMDGAPIALGVFAFGFMGGSMGSVVGERLTRLFERGTSARRPVVVLSASGGARMQEGIHSLMQMAKTVAARGLLSDAGVPFVSVLLHPTTGGVAASYALLGDVNLAEPGALIGFAGPRVIEQTIKQKLPEGFQRSEFLLEHGMIDAIVPRSELRATVRRVVGLLAR
ncbi:MAG: acetyl-CoA carboxylase carboxyltransferase subunit beta [Myxococcaceae bacterium]|nr:MAG: acetyl-CoA carboxylase carboxyltransferase subunit beta [Myxococcaceae bacterium]